MLNPYLLLFGVVFAIGLFGTGVSIGVRWERNDNLAHVATAQNAVIEASNSATAAEIQRTVAAAKTEADVRIAARTARLKGELDAARKSRPECSRDVVSLGMLNDAIAASNGTPPTPSIVSVPVRPFDWAAGRFGIVDPSLGIFIDRTSGAVPAPAR